MTKKENKKEESKKVTRRGFFNKIWAIFGILAGVNIVAITTGFFAQIRTTSKPNGKKNIIVVGNVDEIKPNTVISIRLGRFYLSRLQDGGFIAVSLICSHLGCAVRWESEQKQFLCPCHSSSFDISGNVTNPPAPRALDYYPVIIENGMVKVNIGKRIQRRRFTKSQATYI